MPTTSAPAGRWQEPSARLPLRWGDHATRLWVGLWLLVGGTLAIAGANTEALWVLWLGMLAHVAGWCVLPAAGWRRLVAIAPSAIASAMLLAGPRFAVVLVVPYLFWLLARHRPPLALITAVPVLVAGLLVGDAFGPDLTRMLPALALIGATMLASALLARLLARCRRCRGSGAGGGGVA